MSTPAVAGSSAMLGTTATVGIAICVAIAVAWWRAPEAARTLLRRITTMITPSAALLPANAPIAYLHGFLSHGESSKGVHLQRVLRDKDGVSLQLIDWNPEDHASEDMTISRILQRLDKELAHFTPENPGILCGHSMGGYLAARFAELYPARVKKLFLLAPAFDLTTGHVVRKLGEEVFSMWEREGFLPMPFQKTGNLVRISFDVYRDARENHTEFPRVRCPVLIVHGAGDETVPLSHSERYVHLMRAAGHALHAHTDTGHGCSTDNGNGSDNGSDNGGGSGKAEAHGASNPDTSVATGDAAPLRDAHGDDPLAPPPPVRLITVDDDHSLESEHMLDRIYAWMREFIADGE